MVDVALDRMAHVVGTPHVRISDNSHVWCIRLEPLSRFDKPKPNELISIDVLLWQNFSSEIDKLVSKHNAWMRSTSIFFSMIASLVVTFFFFSTIFAILQPDAGFDYEPIYIIGGFLIVICQILHYVNFVKNQKVDEEIKSVCQTFEQKFKLKGFSIEYQTRNVKNYCNNNEYEEASPVRLIAFPPVPGFQESQTIDDGDGFTDDGAIGYKPPMQNSEKSQTNSDSNGFVDNNLLDPKLWGTK